MESHRRCAIRGVLLSDTCFWKITLAAYGCVFTFLSYGWYKMANAFLWMQCLPFSQSLSLILCVGMGVDVWVCGWVSVCVLFSWVIFANSSEILSRNRIGNRIMEYYKNSAPFDFPQRFQRHSGRENGIFNKWCGKYLNFLWKNMNLFHILYLKIIFKRIINLNVKCKTKKLWI